MRFRIGILFLTIQFVSILYARFIPARYLCWAPYDSINEYSIGVTLESGEKLTDTEIKERYRLPAAGRDNRSIEHVIRVIRQRESYKQVPKSVLLKYRTNGGVWKEWAWPEAEA